MQLSCDSDGHRHRHGRDNVFVQVSAAGHILQRHGRNQLRHRAAGAVLPDVLHLRRDGRNGRPDARHGIFDSAHDSIAGGRVRHTNRVDIHGV